MSGSENIYKRLIRWIRESWVNWIQKTIITNVRIGGWCGLCGLWITDELFPSDWSYGVCILCKTTTSDSSVIKED